MKRLLTKDQTIDKLKERVEYLESELQIIVRSQMSNDHDPHAVRVAKRALGIEE